MTFPTALLNSPFVWIIWLSKSSFRHLKICLITIFKDLLMIQLPAVYEYVFAAPFLFILTVYLYSYLRLSFFGCTGLVSGIATKAAMASPYFIWRTSGRNIFKQMFSLNSVLQIVMVMVLCSFF